jgi:hypothetical protein
MGSSNKPQGNSIATEQNDAKVSSESSSGKETLMDKVGDVLEKVGHKVSEAGAPSIGQKIHDLGDKVEQHHDNKNHPHDV